MAAIVLAIAPAALAVAEPQPNTPRPVAATAPRVPPISEDQLKQQLAGKTFYLRGGYLDNELHFDRNGRLSSSATQASYTLGLIEIERVRLGKHKLELTGIRYGLHFLGAGPTEDPLSASDKVRITPKKKFVRITIDRAQVLAAKKKSKELKAAAEAPPPADRNASPAQQAAESPAPGTTTEFSPVTQAHANQLLAQAVDRVFSRDLDDRMMASLPDFWRFYYQAAAAKIDYRPSDAAVLRQSAVDQKARLLAGFQTPSNDFAQQAGVAGVALYHVVIGADGKPSEIAIGRPIGFGLDENAVASIRKASFQPAVKDGKPVPVLLDLVVEFRIYSKRTGIPGNAEAAASVPAEPENVSLPGPYSANQPATRQP